MKRRKFINRISLSLAGATLLSEFSYPAGNLLKIRQEYTDAETAYGKIRGTRIEGVNIFKGVPYAGKVSGDRRFRRPAPLEPWTGIREALLPGAPSMQSPRRNEPDPAEDCLFLNIWTPANDNKRDLSCSTITAEVM
jgi:para-nitrobenzyl esterase